MQEYICGPRGVFQNQELKSKKLGFWYGFVAVITPTIHDRHDAGRKAQALKNMKYDLGVCNAYGAINIFRNKMSILLFL